ncbi:MAG TPA: hemolysin family protein [Balneolaceae bacterium]|nr:hemolysin family protein [Balneolaceae bacterium]
MAEIFYISITILLSSFFSGSEMAFVTANKLKLEIESRKKGFRGRTIKVFNENPERVLTTTLVGNNIVNVLYATLMAIYLAQPVRNLYFQLTGSLPSEPVVLLIQTIFASILILIFGEIIPKAIFRAHADYVVKIIAIPIQILHTLMWPLIVISNGASNLLVRLLKVGQERSEKVFRRQDVEMIFRELMESGGSEEIDHDDSEILHNVLELSNKRVKETMVPRTDIVAVERDSSLADLKKAFIESGYSKIPVYRDSIDDIIGVVFAYDLFSSPHSISEILRPVKLIPSSKKSKDLLTEFRQSNSSVAIVIDEYGGTAGMVTIEDLIEEVVGDIQDEYDKEIIGVKKLSDNTFIVAGSVELDELMDQYPEITIEHDTHQFETVAGYILHHTGRIPKVNEKLRIDGNTFIISKATQSRLENVKLIINSTN